MFDLFSRPPVPYDLRATLMGITLLVCGSVSAEQPLQFNQHIRPVLAQNCFVCHGLDAGSRKADLRLDDRSIAIDMSAIEPGKPDQSELIARVESADPETVMPPPDSGHKLSAEEIKLLRQWITQGAKYEKHWSFTPPVKVELPKTQAVWSSHPIDRFVLKRIEAVGFSPSQEADRLQLLRRLSLDLTGLPPSIVSPSMARATSQPFCEKSARGRMSFSLTGPCPSSINSTVNSRSATFLSFHLPPGGLGCVWIRSAVTVW